MPKSKERCQEIRDETRANILRRSMLYFAKNGFAGTKIGDLARSIGIAQGTIYIYFKSKEDLFNEIISIADYDKELKQLRLLCALPLPAKAKLRRLSDSVLASLRDDEMFAARTALNTQLMLEKSAEHSAEATSYQTELYRLTASIIEQGQREGSAADGSALKLADYFWGVVYLYSLKRLYTSDFEMISAEDLERTVLK